MKYFSRLGTVQLFSALVRPLRVRPMLKYALILLVVSLIAGCDWNDWRLCNCEAHLAHSVRVVPAGLPGPCRFRPTCSELPSTPGQQSMWGRDGRRPGGRKPSSVSARRAAARHASRARPQSRRAEHRGRRKPVIRSGCAAPPAARCCSAPSPQRCHRPRDGDIAERQNADPGTALKERPSSSSRTTPIPAACNSCDPRRTLRLSASRPLAPRSQISQYLPSEPKTCCHNREKHRSVPGICRRRFQENRMQECALDLAASCGDWRAQIRSLQPLKRCRFQRAGFADERRAASGGRSDGLPSLWTTRVRSMAVSKRQPRAPIAAAQETHRYRREWLLAFATTEPSRLVARAAGGGDVARVARRRPLR